VRSSYTVYRKLREVKYRYLILFYKRYLKKAPYNCKYNYAYKFTGEDGIEHEIRLCLLHQENKENLSKGVFLNLIDVCDKTADCNQCNAFVFKYSKKDIQQIFEEDIKNNKKKYPEICALEWVLERSIIGIPPLNWIQRIFFVIKRWLTKNELF
jgi:hypothetical protein